MNFFKNIIDNAVRNTYAYQTLASVIADTESELEELTIDVEEKVDRNDYDFDDFVTQSDLDRKSVV